MAQPRRRRSLCAWPLTPPPSRWAGREEEGGGWRRRRDESRSRVYYAAGADGRHAHGSHARAHADMMSAIFLLRAKGRLICDGQHTSRPRFSRRPSPGAHTPHGSRGRLRLLSRSRSHAPPRAATLGEHATKLEHALPSYQREQTRQVGCGAEPLSTPPPPRARAPPGPREQPVGVAASSSSRGADSAAVAAVAASSASSAAAGGGMGSSKAAARSLRSPVPSCPA